MCYLKGLVSVYFRCPAKAVGFSETQLYLCLQPAELSDAQTPSTSWLGGGTRGLQPGGHVHKAELDEVKWSVDFALGVTSPSCLNYLNVNVSVNREFIHCIVTKATNALYALVGRPAGVKPG